MAILTILAAVLHEIGHLLAMHFAGDFPREIRCGLFGANINSQHFAISFKKTVLILLAGPGINVGLAAVFGLFPGKKFLIFATVNAALAGFNLLPIAGLDGGRLLFEIILHRTGNVLLSERVLRISSFVVLLPVATLGFYLLLNEARNFSLLFLGCYLITVLLMKAKP